MENKMETTILSFSEGYKVPFSSARAGMDLHSSSP